MPIKIKNIAQFIENTFSLVVVKTIDLVITVLLIPYLILKVGIVNYGKYAFALSIGLFFINIINYGFNLSAVRTIAKEGNHKKKVTAIFNEVFSVKIYLSGFLVFLIIVAVVFVPEFSGDQWLYFFVIGYLLSDLFSLRWFFMGLEKMKYIPVINLVGTLLYVLLVVLFIHKPEDYTYIILFEAIGLLVAGGVSFSYIVSEYNLKLRILSFKEIHNSLYTNFSSFINLMIPSALSNSAILMVGFMGVPTQVAIMQLGVKVSNAFATINAILTKVFYPMVNRKHNIRKTAFWVLVGMGILLSIAMYFSASYLVVPWLKMKDTVVINQVVFIIKLLSPTPLLMALISVYGVNGLLVHKKDKLFSYITITATILGLIVGFLSSLTIGFTSGVAFLLTTRGIMAIGSLLFFKNTKINAA